MKSCTLKIVKAFTIIAIGLVIGASGIYVGENDDAPGAALIGILLMIGIVAFGVKAARHKE